MSEDHSESERTGWGEEKVVPPVAAEGKVTSLNNMSGDDVRVTDHSAKTEGERFAVNPPDFSGDKSPAGTIVKGFQKAVGLGPNTSGK